jgi:hypothetical protein
MSECKRSGRRDILKLSSLPPEMLKDIYFNLAMLSS